MTLSANRAAKKKHSIRTSTSHGLFSQLSMPGVWARGAFIQSPKHACSEPNPSVLREDRDFYQAGNAGERFYSSESPGRFLFGQF